MLIGGVTGLLGNNAVKPLSDIVRRSPTVLMESINDILMPTLDINSVEAKYLDKDSVFAKIDQVLEDGKEEALGKSIPGTDELESIRELEEDRKKREQKRKIDAEIASKNRGSVESK
jgi:hypothetical protein